MKKKRTRRVLRKDPIYVWFEEASWPQGPWIPIRDGIVRRRHVRAMASNDEAEPPR